MRSTTFFVAAAALFCSLASADSASTTTVSRPVSSATYKGPANALSTKGCYSTGDPLEDHGPYLFQSEGNCQGVCLGFKNAVMGMVNGDTCYCGDLLPPKADKVDDDLCNTSCSGTAPELKCGGPNLWWIELTGITKNEIGNFDPSSSSAAAVSTKTSAPAVTIPGSTVLVTAGPTTTPKPSTDSGPNKTAIAAGVVVGVVALVAIIAGVFLFLRQKRRREVEEEYRRQAAVNEFTGAGKVHTSNSSMNDSRLDPEFTLRRQSDGSIADNQDYSRRILKVTNPDGH